MNEYDVIPKRTIESLDRYVNHRIATGGFLRAVLSNDLFGAMSRADLDNQLALSAITKYIYNRLPSGCWGSKEIVDNYLKKE